MLKENPARNGFVTHEQFEWFLAALPERLRPIVTFLYVTGARLGETKKILWSQVDLEGRAIRLEAEQTKNAEPRILPLPDVLVEMFRQASDKTGRLFQVGSFRKAWQTACVEVGLGRYEDLARKHDTYVGLIIHDLRRSAIRNIIQAGVLEQVAMRIRGHKTHAVFARYNIVSEADLHRAMGRVQAAARTLSAAPALPAGKRARRALPARGGASLEQVAAPAPDEKQ